MPKAQGMLLASHQVVPIYIYMLLTAMLAEAGLVMGAHCVMQYLDLKPPTCQHLGWQALFNHWATARKQVLHCIQSSLC